MKLTTSQVGGKLGISGSVVRGLVKRGQLVDVSGKKGRHNMAFDSKAINEFAKVYKGRRRSDDATIVEQEATSSPLGALRRIEAKLDKLIAMWA